MSVPPEPDRRAAARVEADRRALARNPVQSARHAMVQSIPFLVVILPFGLLFGVVATEAGLGIAEILGFSTLVLAGASQFTAVQLMSDHAPVWLVILSALAVNLRMAMYSASLVPWLGAAPTGWRAFFAYALTDQTYALAVEHYERHPQLSIGQRAGYFVGATLMICVPWVAAAYLGATVGRAIPDSFALDFAVPITFLALIAPALRTLAHVAAAGVSVAVALALAWLPAGMGLLVAAPCAMITGALVETRMARKTGGAA